MEQIIALIVEALSSQQATDILTAAGIYIVAPIVTHINIQFLKYDRRERGQKELGRWTLRGIAFILCFAIALFIGWRVGNWHFEDAVDHAANIGMAYPAAMWAYMSWLKKKNPEAYSKLNAPRRRSKTQGDNNNDPGDTGTHWAGDA